MQTDLEFSDYKGQALQIGNLVLCGYRVWSAYKFYGHADGAVMLSVNKSHEIAYEFDRKMHELSRLGERSFAIKEPSRWVMKWYLPYCEKPKF